jgi:hypothetical protein
VKVSKFLTTLKVTCLTDKVWRLVGSLWYESDFLRSDVIVPEGFLTDFASVPRVPLFYWLLGDKAHHEAVIHDYLYRFDSVPVVSRADADEVFLEAMRCRKKSVWVRWPMYMGVRMGGGAVYHKKKVLQLL